MQSAGLRSKRRRLNSYDPETLGARVVAVEGYIQASNGIARMEQSSSASTADRHEEEEAGTTPEAEMLDDAEENDANPQLAVISISDSSGSSQTLNGSLSDAESNEAETDPRNIVLVPACYGWHPLTKGKERMTDPRSMGGACTPWTPECHEGVLISKITGRRVVDPAFVAPVIIDHGAELCHWATNPAPFGSSRQVQRDINYLRQPNLTMDNLKAALMAAFDEVQRLHQHILRQQEYLALEPYCLRLVRNIAMVSIDYSQNARESLLAQPRAVLESAIFTAATEVDRLTNIVELLFRRTVSEKIRHAKDGNESDMQDLLRHGIIDVEWIRRECS